MSKQSLEQMQKATEKANKALEQKLKNAIEQAKKKQANAGSNSKETTNSGSDKNK